MAEAVLHGYFRSTASYRVRIALNLKSVPYADVFHHLRKGEQGAEAYLRLNPQGLLPSFETGGYVLTQSLAICEYLDETVPEPKLLPGNPLQRARIRATAQVIACDTHPLQNLKILDRLRGLGLGDAQVSQWARQTIGEGLGAFARLLPDSGSAFCFGDQPTLADICLVPQLVNARRFQLPLTWSRLLTIEANCLAIDAFRRAAPGNQPDAE